MSEAGAPLTEQATGLWGGATLVQLRRFWDGAAHLGVARTCGECRSLSVPCMQRVSLCHSFTSSKIWILALFRHSENYFGAGKVASNTWEVQAFSYF